MPLVPWPFDPLDLRQAKGIRVTPRPRERGPAPMVIYVAGRYAVLPLEEVFAVFGVPVRESLLPLGGAAFASTVPP